MRIAVGQQGLFAEVDDQFHAELSAHRWCKHKGQGPHRNSRRGDKVLMHHEVLRLASIDLPQHSPVKFRDGDKLNCRLSNLKWKSETPHVSTPERDALIAEYLPIARNVAGKMIARNSGAAFIEEEVMSEAAVKVVECVDKYFAGQVTSALKGYIAFATRTAFWDAVRQHHPMGRLRANSPSRRVPAEPNIRPRRINAVHGQRRRSYHRSGGPRDSRRPEGREDR
jgi:hypothetical protein